MIHQQNNMHYWKKQKILYDEIKVHALCKNSTWIWNTCKYIKLKKTECENDL